LDAGRGGNVYFRETWCEKLPFKGAATDLGAFEVK